MFLCQKERAPSEQESENYAFSTSKKTLFQPTRDVGQEIRKQKTMIFLCFQDKRLPGFRKIHMDGLCWAESGTTETVAFCYMLQIYGW